MSGNTKAIEVDEQKNSKVSHGNQNQLKRFLDIQREFAQAALKTNDSDAFLEHICRIYTRDGNYGFSGFWLKSSEEDKFTLHGSKNEVVFPVKLIDFDHLNQTLLSGRHFVQNNINQNPLSTELYKNVFTQDCASFGFFPLKEKNDLLGFLGLCSPNPEWFNEEEISFIKENCTLIISALTSNEIRERQKLQAELNQARENYKVLFNNPAYAYILSRLSDGKILQINQRFIDSFGYSKQELLGKTANELGLNPNWEDRDDLVEELEKKGFSHNHEVKLVKKNGETGYFLLNIDVLKIDGQLCLLNSGQEITEQKNNELRMRESEEKFKALFQNNHAVMLLIDPLNGQIINVNPAACEFYGWSEEELTHKKIFEINIFSNPMVTEEMHEAVAKENKHFEFRHRLANGEIRDVEVYSGPITHQGKTLLFSIIHDITTRKEVIKEKNKLDDRYRTLVEQASDALFIHGLDGKILEINRQASKSLGYSKEELLQMNIIDIDQDYDRDSSLKILEELKPGDPQTIFGHHKRKDGSIFPVEVRLGCTIWEGEKLFLSLNRDISERLKTEEKIRDDELRRGLALDAAQAAAWEINLTNNDIIWDDRFHDLIRMPADFPEGDINNWLGLILPEHYERVITEFTAACQPGGPTFDTEFQAVRLDGQVRWYHVRGNILFEPGKPKRMFGVIQDINKQKKTEEDIQKHQRNLQLFVKHSPAAIAMFDNNMKYLVVSDRFYTDYHLKIKNILGMSHYEVFPDLPDNLKAVHQRCLNGAVEKGDEAPFPRASGKVDWVRWEMRPWYEKSGEVGGVILFSEVMTERKHAQEQIKLQFLRLKSLHAIDQAIISSFDIQVILDVILDASISSLGVDAANVLLYDDMLHQLKFAAGKGFKLNKMEKNGQQIGKGLYREIILNQKMVQVYDFEEKIDRFPQGKNLVGEGFKTYFGVPLFARGELIGVLEIYHRLPLNPNNEWLDFLKALGSQTAIAIDNAENNKNLQQANLDLTLAYDATIEGWSRAMDLRDKETEGHTLRVTELAIRLARAMNIDNDMLIHARRGALLHDIGKLGVPDEILLKPDSLTPQEFEIMRKHPQYAFDMLSSVNYLLPALDIPYCHHEKWDGSGYPRGLKGEQIPLIARIFAVVDVWDALNSDRPYRKAWPEEKVLEYIREQSGTHFDPQVVEIFLQIMKK